MERFRVKTLMKRLLTAVLGSVFCCLPLCAQFPQPDGGGLRAGTLPLTWNTGGPKCMEMPEWQIHEYNPDLFILRQSGCTDYEKPFLYLFFGKQRALLLDTGSRNGNLVPTLLRLMHQYLERNHLQTMPLVVTHTHSHGDHIAGDKEIQAINDPAVPITFAPPTVEGAKKLFGMVNWPEDAGSIDLGDRVIDCIAIPGHDVASIALYDRQTGILQTGDSLYPGRIYIADFDAFAKSNARLVKFTADRPVSYILGNHIEQQRTPFLDYPVGTTYQPNEHPLQLYRGALLEMQAAIEALHGTAKRVAYSEFSLWPSGRAFPTTEKERETGRATRKFQADHKWDFTQP
jgi:glyoxylase-like metal-dependent hydrolase (beta-lactamase superfamily II)